LGSLAAQYHNASLMATRSPFRTRHRVPSLGDWLDPIDRLSETVFSILILLTFTLAFRIIRLSGNAEQALSPEIVNDLLLGSLGAILTWGLIDGVMYALLSLFERGEQHRMLKNLQAAQTEQEAVDAIAENLDYILEPITDESVRQDLYKSVFVHLRDSQPRKIGFTREDFTGALAHILVAVLAVLPSLAPLFILRGNPELAIRASNLVSFTILFVEGYRWGKYTGDNPWRTGLLLMTVALGMVLIAIPLGG
jgi:hypothetical protein